MEKYQEIERSIIKRFRKDIWAKFVKAVAEYELIKENDKIMVCISGGKDSFLLAKCMEEIQKHGKFPFDVHYVCMNPGYNEKNKELILENAKKLNIDLEMFESDIFEIVDGVEKSPCYLCARMRRGCLYNKAKELGCNKIALGHHFDDVIETTLLSMFYGAEIKTMMPKLHSENFEGLEQKASIDESSSKRKEMKNLVKEMRKNNPNVDYNIYKALDNVNLNCVIGTKKDGEYESFLGHYE